MSGSRLRGGLLLLLGAAVFAAINASLVPAQLVWLALALAGVGFFQFMKANRVAMRAEEERLERSLHPRIDQIRPDAMNQRTPRRVEDLGIAALEGDRREAATSIADAMAPIETPSDELTLYEVDEPEGEDADGDFRVTSDVSFPVEVQENARLSEELARLQRLHEDGVISADELAVAKAKLLS